MSVTTRGEQSIGQQPPSATRVKPQSASLVQGETSSTALLALAATGALAVWAPAAEVGPESVAGLSAFSSA